jgi:hypothetical protein
MEPRLVQVGLDISAKKFDATFQVRGKLTTESHTYDNDPEGHVYFLGKLSRLMGKGTAEVCFESTGVYSLDIALLLHGTEDVGVIFGPREALLGGLLAEGDGCNRPADKCHRQAGCQRLSCGEKSRSGGRTHSHLGNVVGRPSHEKRRRQQAVGPAAGDINTTSKPSARRPMQVFTGNRSPAGRPAICCRAKCLRPRGRGCFPA